MRVRYVYLTIYTFSFLKRDKHLSKELDTWKSNNLQKEIDKRIKELYPNETEEKKQLSELNDKKLLFQ